MLGYHIYFLLGILLRLQPLPCHMLIHLLHLLSVINNLIVD